MPNRLPCTVRDLLTMASPPTWEVSSRTDPSKPAHLGKYPTRIRKLFPQSFYTCPTVSLKDDGRRMGRTSMRFKSEPPWKQQRPISGKGDMESVTARPRKYTPAPAIFLVCAADLHKPIMSILGGKGNGSCGDRGTGRSSSTGYDNSKKSSTMSVSNRSLSSFTTRHSGWSGNSDVSWSSSKSRASPSWLSGGRQKSYSTTTHGSSSKTYDPKRELLRRFCSDL